MSPEQRRDQSLNKENRGKKGGREGLLGVERDLNSTPLRFRHLGQRKWEIISFVRKVAPPIRGFPLSAIARIYRAHGVGCIPENTMIILSSSSSYSSSSSSSSSYRHVRLLCIPQHTCQHISRQVVWYITQKVLTNMEQLVFCCAQ